MSDLVLYIVKSLVNNPDAVSVEEYNEGGQVNLLLTVDPADMGLVIGKNGQTIKAIRKVLIVKAMADNVRVNLQLSEPAGGRVEKEESVEKPEQSAETTQDASEGKRPRKAKKLAENNDASTAEASEELAEKHADEIAEQD